MHLYSILLTLLSFPPVYFYDIQLTTVDGKTISMADYKGKRVFVATIDLNEYNEKQLFFLDSIQRHTPDMQVIIIPKEIEGLRVEYLRSDARDLKSSVIIAKPAQISKEAGPQQNKLMEWLTKSEHNQVFNFDGNAGQFFLVSVQGTICAVLESPITEKELLSVINYPFDLSQHHIFNTQTQKYELPKN